MDSGVTFLLRIPHPDLGFRGLGLDFGKEGTYFPDMAHPLLTQTILAKLSLML